jgi:hypothetical protein
VIQHVLEHGRDHERSEIITKLAGQIVQMSQHKFASNVVEKCLEYGGPVERQILIDEMLGLTDENEPLQVHWEVDWERIGESSWTPYDLCCTSREESMRGMQGLVGENSFCMEDPDLFMD